MLTLGTHFWPPGPPTVDWTVDLSDGSFGPLRAGSTLGELKTALGQPDNTQVFGAQRYFFYDRFNLSISVDDTGRITDFEVEIPERADAEFGDDEADETPVAAPADLPFGILDTEPQRFDPLVKLPGMAAQRLRRLTVEDCERAFGSSGRIEDEGSESAREWTRHGLAIYVDLMADGRTISGVGWMLSEE